MSSSAPKNTFMQGKINQFLAQEAGFWGKLRDVVSIKSDLSGETEVLKLIEAASTGEFYSGMSCKKEDAIQVTLMHIMKAIREAGEFDHRFFVEGHHYEAIRDYAEHSGEALQILTAIRQAYDIGLYDALDLLFNVLEKKQQRNTRAPKVYRTRRNIRSLRQR